MRCLVCHCFSWSVLCKKCYEWIEITPQVRVVDEHTRFKVYSFFDYDSIAYIIHSKYQLIGSSIFYIISQKIASFIQKHGFFEALKNVKGIPIDDIPRGGYSHTAIMARAFHKVLKIPPLYCSLHSSAHVKYAGKSLAFRQQNPRCFKTSLTPNDVPYGVILYDDVLTTGSTMKEAHRVLAQKNIVAHIGITLASHSYRIGHIQL